MTSTKRSKRSNPVDLLAELLIPVSFYWSLVLLVWDKQRYDIVHSNPLFNWNSSEWLIGYQGGFVRRGLFGTFARFLIERGIDKNLVLTLFPSLCFFLLASLWFSFALRAYLRDSRVKAGALACFLINPSALFFFLTNGNIFRKDIVFIVLLFASFALIHFCLTSDRLNNGPGGLIASAVVGVSGLAMLGLHEGLYVFIALPLSALLFYRCWRSKSNHLRAFGIGVASGFAIVLVAAVLSIAFNGDGQNVLAICRSWAQVWASGCTPEDLPNLGAISALGWTRAQAISVSGLRNIFSGYSPLNILSLVFFSALTSRVVCALTGKAGYYAFRNTMAYLFWPCCILFVVGCDWGRFMSVVLTFACLVAVSLPSAVPDLSILPAAVRVPVGSAANALDRVCLPANLNSTYPASLQYWVAGVTLFVGMPVIGYTSLAQIFSTGVWSALSDRVIWILTVFFNQSIAR